MSDDLRPVLKAIQAGDKRRARQLLRPMLANPTADVLFLAARVTDNRERIIDLLQQALTLDPGHKRAARVLTILAPEKAAALASGQHTAESQASEAPSSIEDTPIPAELTQHSAPTEVLNQGGSPFKPQLPATPPDIAARAYMHSGQYSPISLAVITLIGLALGGAAAYLASRLLIAPLADRLITANVAEPVIAAITGLVSLAGLIAPAWLSGQIMWQVVKAGRIRHAGRACQVTSLSFIAGLIVLVLLVRRAPPAPLSVPILIVGAPVWAVLMFRPTRIGITHIPYAEEHGRWYDQQVRTVTIKETAASLLMTILESQTPERLQSITPVSADHYPRLELRLRKCSTAPAADHHLTVIVHWKDVQEGKPDRSGKSRITTHAQQQEWFQTMIPAALGNALEEALFTPPPPSSQ